MERIKALVREPALLLDLLETIFVALVAVGLFNITGDQQRYTVGVFIALIGLVKAVSTKPFPITVIPDLTRALLVCFGSYSLIHLSADQVTVLVTLVGTLLTAVTHAQITPRLDPAVGHGETRSVSARGESGASTFDLLFIVGLILLVAGLLSLFTHWVTLPVAIVFVVVGILVCVVPYSRRRM